MNTMMIKKYDFEYQSSPYRLVLRCKKKDRVVEIFQSAGKAREYCSTKPIGKCYVLIDNNDMPVFRRDKRGAIYYDI